MSCPFTTWSEINKIKLVILLTNKFIHLHTEMPSVKAKFILTPCRDQEQIVKNNFNFKNLQLLKYLFYSTFIVNKIRLTFEVVYCLKSIHHEDFRQHSFVSKKTFDQAKKEFYKYF